MKSRARYAVLVYEFTLLGAHTRIIFTKAANRSCLKVESVRIHIHMRETRHQTR